jgi:chaperonin GroEL (HSP60 family)
MLPHAVLKTASGLFCLNAVLCRCAGEEGAVIVGKLLESHQDENTGYNAAAGKFENMVSAGIIDPVKVRCARFAMPVLRATAWRTRLLHMLKTRK